MQPLTIPYLPVTHWILLGGTGAFRISALEDDAVSVPDIGTLYGQTLVTVNLHLHSQKHKKIHNRQQAARHSGRQAGRQAERKGSEYSWLVSGFTFLYTMVLFKAPKIAKKTKATEMCIDELEEG